MKTVSKYEYAQRVGISRRTLGAWLNVRYYDDLTKLGYTKRQKLLLPNQIDFLNQKLCVQE